MKTYRVVFSKRADQNILRILRYIAKESSARIAEAYITRVISECETLSWAPHRGDHITFEGKKVRRFGFEKSVAILHRIQGDRVEIVAVQYRGINLNMAL